MKIQTNKPNPNELMTVELQINKPTVQQQKVVSTVSSSIGVGLAAIGIVKKNAPSIITGGIVLAAGLAGYFHAKTREE